MARSPCFLKNVWKLSLSEGIISIPRGADLKPHTPIFQPGTIRYRDIYTRPFIGRHPSVHPLCTTACLNVKRSIAQRSYVTFSRSRIRSVGSTILTVSLVGAIIYIGFVASEVWYFYHPPQLSEWPEEVRKPLVRARASALIESKEDVLDNFERAWIAVQTVPRHTLNPDPSVKIMRVAIWFANALEICGQSHKAYKVLCDAIGLHQAQSEKYSSTSASADMANTMLDPAILAKKRYLITLYAKLASLSEKCDPNSEGKWLSRAIREVFLLLPLPREVSFKNYVVLIQAVETFLTDEPSFSGLVSELNSQLMELASHQESGQTSAESTESHNVSINEVIVNEEAFLFPTWYLRDISSAVAAPFERIGLYAVRHGRSDVALAAYMVAANTISGMIQTYSIKDTTITDWGHLVQLLRLLNRRVDLFLDLLKTETNPTEWLHILSKSHKENLRTEFLAKVLFVILDEKAKKAKVWVKLAEVEKDWEVEAAKSTLHLARYHEKIGNTPGAMSYYSEALHLLQMRQHPSEDARKVEDRIKALQQSMAKGKTTIESHMNPLALKAWEEMKTMESKSPEEAYLPTSSDA